MQFHPFSNTVIVAALANAGRETQRKTKYNEITIYFYSFSKLKIPNTFKSTIKILQHCLLKWKSVFIPKHRNFLLLFKVSC